MVIDLRSDTVTKPGPAMRKAMAEAEVGDDVFAEDPTVNRLQERAAEILGKEAALYMPSGSMCNQVALKCHTQPGDEVLAGQGTHSYLFESGAAGAISGVQVTLLAGDGRYTADQVDAAIKPPDHHFTPTRLVVVENTHNMGGGLVWDKQQLDELMAAAKQHKLRAHLDGARLWNAVAASGISAADWAYEFDTVSVCMSKGLGAPVGSLLAGTAETIDSAHRYRKMFGGGMRQAGVIAAAALYALNNHRDRLKEDHIKAMTMARTLNKHEHFSVDTAQVHTNIVMVDLSNTERRASSVVEHAQAAGVRSIAMGPKRIRLVCHRDVTMEQCKQAAEVLCRAFD